MCAIVDANVSSEVFGDNLPSAGSRFFDWIDGGNGRLVVGGKLLDELARSSPGFRVWARKALSIGKLRLLNEREVAERTLDLAESGELVSDDPHVIALAQLSGARLLYSNDSDLQSDFGNRRLLNNPRGRVYSTDSERNPTKRFTNAHRDLLNRRDLCSAAGR